MTTQTGAKHTPWSVRKDTAANFRIIDAEGFPICVVSLQEYAELIVTAVNAYSTLIASVDVARLALENAEAVMSYVEPRNEKAEYLDCLKQIRSALSSLPTARVKP